ncbi:L-amino acid N-acyltransferase YncA [Haloactinopolyspora alba]|uniref:L-amino acid N-acyltransferase YncA n=1 Tax=Haloactinopolyspora alba TaxID=648780 RepID=A0A2P8DR86_9ACTN|nr:GNAT family N-acetyltransferase [Haloactinopolyspora alba]PSK99725.1 L-amino acid N-acyltransferase YncA [Haloactinopolyspora alba]
MRIRPMQTGDVGAAERITARAFTWTSDGHWTERSPQARDRWSDRARHLLALDPGGCWVLDDDRGDVAGVALAARRDLLWILSSFAVDPDQQGRGAGRALLDAVIDYGDGCLRGMLCALPNPAALRRYRGAGFTVHPTMRLAGRVDRATLPVMEGVRVGTDADLDLVDSVDRRVRGATRRGDHTLLARYGPLLVCDLLTGSGYAWLDGSSVGPLAATSRAIAQRLLWFALSLAPGDTDVAVRYLTAEQEWAVDVGLAAGLAVHQDGFLGLRHMRPPAPYVPSVPFG